MVRNQLSPSWLTILGRIVTILFGFFLSLLLIRFADESLFRSRVTSFTESLPSNLELIGPSNLEIAGFMLFSIALWSLIYCLGILSFLRPQAGKNLFSPLRIAAFFTSIMATIYLTDSLHNFLTLRVSLGAVRYSEMTVMTQLTPLLIQLLISLLITVLIAIALSFCTRFPEMRISIFPRLVAKTALIFALVSSALMLIFYIVLEQIDSTFLYIDLVLLVFPLISTATATAIGLVFRIEVDKITFQKGLTNWLQE